MHFPPKVAEKIRIAEPESDVDPTFFANMRGEAIWDAISLWTLPIAGILLIINNTLWTYFGLVGGGMYLYLTGRGIASRLTMQRRVIHIGKSKNLKLDCLVLILWGIIAMVTIIMAIAILLEH